MKPLHSLTPVSRWPLFVSGHQPCIRGRCIQEEHRPRNIDMWEHYQCFRQETTPPGTHISFCECEASTDCDGSNDRNHYVLMPSDQYICNPCRAGDHPR